MRAEKKKESETIRGAIIGAVATILAALLTIFLPRLLDSNQKNNPETNENQKSTISDVSDSEDKSVHFPVVKNEKGNESAESNDKSISVSVIGNEDTSTIGTESLSVISRYKLSALPNESIIETLEIRDTLTDAPENAVDLSEDEDRGVLCWREGKTIFIAGEGGFAAPKNCWGLFQSWSVLRTISGAEYLDTSGVTDMSWMFFDCRNLETLDVSKWNTENVTDMNHMFCDCSSLETLDVSKWIIRADTDTSEMFSGTKWESNPPL